MLWFGHGLPMLLDEGQWVQPRWPAPPCQPRLTMPLSLWRQRRSKVMAMHPEWRDSQEGRQRAVTAVQQELVADARTAFGQPGGSHLQQPQAWVQQPAAQTGVRSVQGLTGRWYHTRQLSSLSRSPGAPSAGSTCTARQPACPSPTPPCWATMAGTLSLARRWAAHAHLLICLQGPAVHAVCTTSMCPADTRRFGWQPERPGAAHRAKRPCMSQSRPEVLHVHSPLGRLSSCSCRPCRCPVYHPGQRSQQGPPRISSSWPRAGCSRVTSAAEPPQQDASNTAVSSSCLPAHSSAGDGCCACCMTAQPSRGLEQCAGQHVTIVPCRPQAALCSCTPLAPARQQR